MHNTLPRRARLFLAAAMVACALAFSGCAGGPKPPPESAPTYELTILATNDLHGHIDTLPEYLTIIHQIRQEKENVLLLDAGDVFRRGPYEARQGAVEIELLNQMGYDAFVLGNNEFKVPGSVNSKYEAGTLAESDAQIANIIKWAKFPILCGNVTLKDTGAYIDGTSPYIVKEVGNLKVGIIGVTNMQPAENKLEMAADKRFVRGDRSVKWLLPKVKAESDIQIVLSHAGYSVDKKMQGVSAIIGGHDHIILENVKNKCSIPVTQGGGEDNHCLSRLDLTFAQQDGTWALHDFQHQLYRADGTAKDPSLTIPPAP